jgi:hypothetical protein
MIGRLVSTTAATLGAIAALILSAGIALAEKRVALVIGNSAYQSVPQLPNPSRDATGMARMLRDAGFDIVDVQTNLSNVEFKRAIRRFEAEADQADVAVIFYAGHGIEIGGTNYLVPIDAKLASDRDSEDEAISLERLMGAAEGARKLRLIILDACRHNPFAVSMKRERRGATRAVNSGLGKVEPTSSDTLIAYAAKAGSTAADGAGEHSPFTAAILKNLAVPGLDLRLAFGRVRDDVLKATENRQEPFVYGSLGGGVISLVPAPAVAEPAAVSDVKADYDLVARIGTRKAWKVFLDTHKSGFYADLARVQLASLEQTPDVPSVPAKVVPPSRDELEFGRIRDTTDQAELQKFIRRFPGSPFVAEAQQRLDALRQAAKEQEERARAEREAVRKAAEEARIAAQQREAELRAKAAEAEQRAKAEAAERKAAEARRKAEEAARTKAEAEAAALRAASERESKRAEEERRKAQAAAMIEANCKDEQTKLEALNAAGSEGDGIENMKAFQQVSACLRLKSVIAAALDKLNAEAASRSAAQPNSPQLIRAAQIQLARIGCLAEAATGKATSATTSALSRYLTLKGQPSAEAITEELVADLAKEKGRLCPLECKAGETASGSTCVAVQKERPPAPPAQRRRNDGPAVAQQRPARRDQGFRPPAQIRQQASARPGGGGGGGAPMIGVGF